MPSTPINRRQSNMDRLSPTSEAVAVGGGRRGLILGIDHPMVDITCHVDDDFISKYDVPIGGACLASAQQMPLYGEMSEMPNVEYSPGGTSLNTVRVAHWVLGFRQGGTGYIGAVGNDKHGDYLVKKTKEEGIIDCYMRSDLPTAMCACIIKDKERALVTRLVAANEYRADHLEENMELVRGAQIIYSTAFFFNCFGGESIFKAAKETMNTGSLFCFNLGAPYLQGVHKEKLAKIMNFTDVIFGNEDEAEAYAQENGLADGSPVTVAKHLAHLPSDKERPRVAVVTRGSHSTVLCTSDGVYMEIPVPKVDPSKICDLNAAGDAFVGGFLAALSQNENLYTCVATAHKSAGHIIQNTGCTFRGSFSPLKEAVMERRS